MSDVIVVMRDGLIQQQGSPESLYRRPVNRFVAGFIGSSNFVEARMVGAPDASGRVDLSCRRGAGLRRSADGHRTARRGGGRDHRTAAGERPAHRRDCRRARRRRPAGPGCQAACSAARTSATRSSIGWMCPASGNLISRAQTQTAGHATRAYGPGEAVRAWWHEDATLVLTN